ncbi:hypothetical protein Bbelb_336620 [Branchiostoma belcheri]|nr:hypothetical protein Bbelb_336620 [Branchiostoma belcheri]
MGHKIGGMSGLEPGTSWFRVEHAAVAPHNPNRPYNQRKPPTMCVQIFARRLSALEVRAAVFCATFLSVEGIGTSKVTHLHTCTPVPGNLRVPIVTPSPGVPKHRRAIATDLSPAGFPLFAGFVHYPEKKQSYAEGRFYRLYRYRYQATMSPATVSVPRPGSWSSRPPSVGSSRRSSLNVSVARLKSEFPILLPGFTPQDPARDTLTLPDVPEWGFYLGVDQAGQNHARHIQPAQGLNDVFVVQTVMGVELCINTPTTCNRTDSSLGTGKGGGGDTSVKKLDLSPPDRPNRIEVMVYCGEDAIVRTFPAKKTLRDVYIWVRATLTHAKIPPRLVLTSGGVQYPASGSGADTRLYDLPNVFEILGTVQPPAEDDDDKLKVRVRAGMDTLVGKFDPKDAFRALYAWVRATLAFKKRPRAFVLKSAGQTYALTEENVEKMMQEFPDEFELVELKNHEIPGARLKKREAEQDDPSLRYPDLTPRSPPPPPPSRDRSPHPENRILKTGLDVDLRKRPKTRRKEREKPNGNKEKRDKDGGDSSTDDDEDEGDKNNQNNESEGDGESDQFSSRAPPPPRLLSREKDDRKRGNKRRDNNQDSRNKRDGKNKQQDRSRHGNGTPDYLFDVGERLRGGNVLPSTGLQITIPSVHGLVSRFELPMDLRELDTLTPRQYLSKYCKLNKTRHLVYKEIFDKQDLRHSGSLTLKDVLKAVQELYARDALREHTRKVEGVEQTEREKLENADFTALDWKLHDRDISGPLKALLHAL